MIDPSALLGGGAASALPMGGGSPMDAASAPGMVDPGDAHYMDPSEGPFACSNCTHFTAPNACEVLSAPVDPKGLCNLFAKGGASGPQAVLGGAPTDTSGPQPKLGSPQLMASIMQDMSKGQQ